MESHLVDAESEEVSDLLEVLTSLINLPELPTFCAVISHELDGEYAAHLLDVLRFHLIGVRRLSLQGLLQYRRTSRYLELEIEGEIEQPVRLLVQGILIKNYI
jgi:hypothetical protein